MSKTNILAETLAEIQELREAVSMNANHALKSTLKEELEEIVKNNLEEIVDDEEFTNDMPGDDLPGDLDQADNNDDGMGDNSTELSGEEGEEVIDLTDKSDEDVINHFNLMEPADEIEIVQTPEGGLQININPSSKEGSEEEVPADDAEVPADDAEVPAEDTDELKEGNVDEYGDEHPTSTNAAVKQQFGESHDEMIKEEEPVFEIEIKEEDTTALAELSHEKMEGYGNNEAKHKEETVEETVESDEKLKEKELHESLVIMRKKYQEAVAENNKKTKELTGFKNLTEEFKSSESDYKSAIKNLKSQLQEVALFSSNLTYSIKLITENSTTKDEKLDILKRFDSAKNLNESREIFNTMQSQFSSNKTATKQMVEEKIMETPKASGSSKLNESTAYTNPQLDRIREIIGKI